MKCTVVLHLYEVYCCITFVWSVLLYVFIMFVWSVLWWSLIIYDNFMGLNTRNKHYMDTRLVSVWHNIFDENVLLLVTFAFVMLQYPILFKTCWLASISFLLNTTNETISFSKLAKFKLIHLVYKINNVKQVTK